MGFRIGTSGADFRSVTKIVADKVKKQVEAKIHSYGFNLLQNLALATPILTGQAKANWQASIGRPDGLFIGLHGPTSDLLDLAHRPPQAVDWAAYQEQAQAVVYSYTVGQVLYIYSNLPYIQKLNDGSSRQAPAGFVETAIIAASAAVKG